MSECGVHVRYTDGRIAFPPTAMMGMYNLGQPPKMSAACERGAHWECTMPGCKCPHHDYIKKPDKRKDPAVGETKEQAMTMAAGKR